MDDKQIRKISKKELLEIMLSQAKRIEELELEVKKYKKRLLSKKILISESGSIAEASLKLNGIFESAQQAIDQYVSNIYEKCKKMELETEEECQRMKTEALEYVTLVGKKAKKVSKTVGKENSKKIKNKLVKKDKKRKVNA